MNSTFVNPVLTESSALGIGLYEDSQPVELFAHASQAEKENVIRAIYRQVLGNAYIMESDRLSIAESQLNLGDLTVREFVRHLAKSKLYRSLFFDSYSNFRAIELNFKHLLGRAPHSYQEIAEHSQILHQAGYEAEIDSYLDSEEYFVNFGDNIVPYYRGYKTQTGKNLTGFTHMFGLLRGSCSSDRSSLAGTKPHLQTALINHQPSKIRPLATGSTTDINQLLQKVLQPKAQSVPTTQQFVAYTYTPSKPKADTIEQEIADLEAELAQLQSVAAIGSAGVNKWQSYYTNIEESSSSTTSYSSKQERVANLKQQIAQAKSLASVGEARLNKWRSRVFY